LSYGVYKDLGLANRPGGQQQENEDLFGIRGRFT